MIRMTSSLNPGGTTSDSMSVTKPYLYGWRTWASMPLVTGAPWPEVLCMSEVAMKFPWRNRILRELLGIVKCERSGCRVPGVRCPAAPSLTPDTRHLSVDVPIHFPHQPLVILRRVEVVDHGRVVHRDHSQLGLVGEQDGSGPVPGRDGAPRQLLK